MDTNVQKIYNALMIDLYKNSPRMSGNMQSNLQLGEVKDNSMTIIINAPYYDINQWKKDGQIVLTNKQSKNGTTDYAEVVNSIGAFGKRNKSTHWVNKTCLEVVNTIAQEIGAIVINKLPVD